MLVVGRVQGVARTLAVTSPTIFRAINVNDWRSDLSGLNDVHTVNDFSGYATKVTYMAPANLFGGVLGGLQMGVSYSPSLRNCGDRLCAPEDGFVLAPDGSFRIRIPANTPITWELVDGTGRVAVRERMFNSVQPGEVHTCAGCHGRIDIQNNIDLGRQAFKPTGPGFHDLRGLFEDFYGTVIDNTPEE